MYFGITRLLGPKQAVTTYTLPYTQPFIDVTLRNWYTNGGIWTLRSEQLSQTQGGEEAGQLHIPLKLIEDAPYHASVYINIRKDTKAAGLAFNSQYPDLTLKQHRVYLSQPAKDKLELVSGYTDETGAFTPQAQIPVPLNTSDFRLDLFVYENTYLVQLNGQRIIDKRPLFYQNGMLGFYAIGPANFDTFSLTAADTVNPGDQVYTSDFDQEPGGAGWVPFGGDWRVTGGQMVQQDPAAFAAGIGYETSTFQNFVLQATFQHLQGSGAGVLFNMPSPYQINRAHIVRFSDETDALIWGYYDAQGIFNRQGYLETAAPGTGEHTLKIFSGSSSYDVYLDGQIMARDVPLMEIQGAIGLFTSQASAGYSRVEVFPLFGSTPGAATEGAAAPAGQASPAAAQASPAAAQATPAAPKPTAPAATAVPVLPTPAKPQTLPAATPAAPPAAANPSSNAASTANFTGDMNASGWRPLNGDWAFSGGSLVQNNPAGVDWSIVYTPQTFTNFSLEVGLTHQSGYGAGVLFNMPYVDRLNGAYLVRYSDRRPGAIFWGHYDDLGTFIGDGYANVPEASTDRHLFRIVSKDTSYEIYLDGNLIVKDLPLMSSYGYIGLLTSNSAVVYDSVVVAGSAAQPQSVTVTDGFSDVSLLSGKWETNGSTITQQVTDIGEYILNSGIYAKDYTIEAHIQLPNGGETGGGFIFHMPDRGSRKGAYMVRLINGGQGIFWGRYDDTGQFRGQSSARLPAAKEHVLKLVVSGNRMDVLVDDKAVFSGVNLDSSEGWLGLISHGGVVQFTQIKTVITGMGSNP
ncbi:MAG: hypothetical protein ACKOC5_11330 [Chloroflexota bacterium]